jgi:hypothetical protein
MVMHSELDRMWDKGLENYSKLLTRNSPGGTEEQNMELRTRYFQNTSQLSHPTLFWIRNDRFNFLGTKHFSSDEHWRKNHGKKDQHGIKITVCKLQLCYQGHEIGSCMCAQATCCSVVRKNEKP